MMMNSAIGAENKEKQCPQSLMPTTEKRKHAEVGDDSPPQSKPIPPEKRSCVENVDPLPLDAYDDSSSDDEIGDLGGNFFVPENHDPEAEYRNFTRVCLNPFIPLNLKENQGLYADLKVFAEKVLLRYNTTRKTELRFKDFEEVTSCQSDCSHHSVRINVIDPLNNISLVILRGRLRSGGTFAVANLQDFLIIGAF